MNGSEKKNHNQIHTASLFFNEMTIFLMGHSNLVTHFEYLLNNFLSHQITAKQELKVEQNQESSVIKFVSFWKEIGVIVNTTHIKYFLSKNVRELIR